MLPTPGAGGGGEGEGWGGNDCGFNGPNQSDEVPGQLGSDPQAEQRKGG